MLDHVIQGFKGDATDAFNAKLYGAVHPNVRKFVANQFQVPLEMLDDHQRAFYTKAQAAYLSNVSEEAEEFNRRIINTHRVDDVFGDKHIAVLGSLYEFRRAGPTMAHWTMVNPVLREEWLHNRIDGYSTLIDAQTIPAADMVSGEAHRDYRRVMTGVVTTQGNPAVEESELSWGWIEYSEPERDGESPLSAGQVFDILQTWANAEALLDEGIDPTDVTEPA
jgi:hypothetical protein